MAGTQGLRLAPAPLGLSLPPAPTVQSHPHPLLFSLSCGRCFPRGGCPPSPGEPSVPSKTLPQAFHPGPWLPLRQCSHPLLRSPTGISTSYHLHQTLSALRDAACDPITSQGHAQKVPTEHMNDFSLSKVKLFDSSLQLYFSLLDSKPCLTQRTQDEWKTSVWWVDMGGDGGWKEIWCLLFTMDAELGNKSAATAGRTSGDSCPEAGQQMGVGGRGPLRPWWGAPVQAGALLGLSLEDVHHFRILRRWRAGRISGGAPGASVSRGSWGPRDSWWTSTLKRIIEGLSKDSSWPQVTLWRERQSRRRCGYHRG